MNTVRSRSDRLLIGLCIAFSVLTLSTIGLGAATLVLRSTSGGTTAEATPTPTPEPSDVRTVTTIDGYEISAVTDLAVERFALSVDAGGTAHVYAVMTNNDQSRAAKVFVDITTYREDGSIVDRSLDILYAQPGTQTVLASALPDDLDDAVSIVIEQTGVDWLDPGVDPRIEFESLSDPVADDLLEVHLTSVGSETVDYTGIIVFALVDDEVVGVCPANTMIPPSGSTFEMLCNWEPSPVADAVDLEDLPKDIEFIAYTKLDAPFD